MLKTGEKQVLEVVKKVEFGVYLGENQQDEKRVLLPIKQVPEGTELGSKLEVFLYLDSQDRLIATTREPMLTLGQFGVLRVLETGKIGAFLDWGLEKDLFLPFKEQVRKVAEGDQVLVRLYQDKSGRLCASTKGIYQLLRTDSAYQKDDEVEGRVYDFSDNFGVFVAVDDCFSALLPHKEAHPELKLGQIVEARVTGVKPDGKLDLTMREKAYLQMDQDAEAVMGLIEQYAGVLPFTDKAPAEIILRETGLSKNAFKRAVGRLYKERRIEITERGIRKIK